MRFTQNGGERVRAPAAAATCPFSNGAFVCYAFNQPAPHRGKEVRGKYTLLDRPLMEAKEAIGGFGILDVADLEEALAIVKTMPQPDGKIEVRPIIERER
jgi:hypothetical protein